MKTTDTASARRLKIVVNFGLIVIAAVVGLAIGFLWHREAPAVTEVNRSTADITAVSGAAFSNLARVGFSPSPTTGEALPAADDSPLASRLERDVSMSSGVTRWLYWLEAVEKATLNDFPRLARMASGNSVLTRLVAARWVELSPRHLFDALVAAEKSGRGLDGEFSSTLLAEWPKRDPDGVITALSEEKHFGNRNSWRMRVVTSLFDNDPERGLRLMHEWRIENYGPNMDGVAKWAAANPRHAAGFALAHPAGFASQRTMETIGKEWAKSDPAGALAFALSQSGELPTLLANSALKEWAGRNLTQAGEWLVALDPQERNRLSPVLVEAWAKQDAASALTWCEENLTGSALAQSVAGVVKGAADKDVVAAAALVSAMHPTSARIEAAVAVAQRWIPNTYANKSVPPEAIAWIGSLDSASLKSVLNQTCWSWSESDPNSLAEFLAQADPAAVPEHAYFSLVRSLSRRNPETAIEWAGRLPEERRSVVASQAFNEWWNAQPEAAMQWRNNLPDADPRREQFFQNAIHSLAHQAQAADKLALLNDTERARARRIIERMPLNDERRATLLDALQRP